MLTKLQLDDATTRDGRHVQPKTLDAATKICALASPLPAHRRPRRAPPLPFPLIDSGLSGPSRRSTSGKVKSGGLGRPPRTLCARRDGTKRGRAQFLPRLSLPTGAVKSTPQSMDEIMSEHIMQYVTDWSLGLFDKQIHDLMANITIGVWSSGEKMDEKR